MPICETVDERPTANQSSLISEEHAEMERFVWVVSSLFTLARAAPLLASALRFVGHEVCRGRCVGMALLEGSFRERSRETHLQQSIFG